MGNNNKKSNRYQKKKTFFERRNREKEKNYEICPICNKPIHTVSTSIIHKETGKRAHFDCLLKELKKEYHLNPDEDIFYIGAGRFGIVEKIKKGKNINLVIKRRIQYEDRSI